MGVSSARVNGKATQDQIIPAQQQVAKVLQHYTVFWSPLKQRRIPSAVSNPHKPVIYNCVAVRGIGYQKHLRWAVRSQLAN
eukprot:5576164-Amphidinium_carterae.1